MASESANEFMIQAIAHRTPPTKITIRGPYLSTNQPSIGTSHVSNRTNSVNATWIDARSQPNFFWMSGTKNVQPYCRLAIITMQMTPTMSWVHGFEKNDLLEAAAGVDAISFSSVHYFLAVSLARDYRATYHFMYKVCGISHQVNTILSGSKLGPAV